jgi:hypothetical protein
VLVSPPTSRQVVDLSHNRTSLCAHDISENFVVQNKLCLGTVSSMADNTADSTNVDGEPKAQKKQVCRFFTTKGMYLGRGKHISLLREISCAARHRKRCQNLNVLTPHCRMPSRRRLPLCSPYRRRWTIFSAKTGPTRWQQIQCTSKPTAETVPSAACR